MIILNEALLENSFENIKKLIDDNARLSLAWLLVKDDKCAMLIVCSPKGKEEEDCLLFDLSGKLLYRQHYNDTNSCSYCAAFDFFDTKYNKLTRFSDVINVDKIQYELMISETENSIKDIYTNVPEDEWMKEALAESPLKEIRYICSIFKLNKLFGIPYDDMQTGFYLRYAAVNMNDKDVLYHDIEYITEGNEFLRIDDFIIDII